MLKTSKIDLHMHLAGIGCNSSGVWLSSAFRKSLAFKFLKTILGITKEQMNSSVDIDWALMMSRLVKESGLDYGVALGFDGVYDHASGEIDWNSSQMIIPPMWVFKVCRAHKNLLPAPSINPHRRDSLDVLMAAHEAGAVMIKWLPAAQAIDVGSPKHKRFYEVVSAANIPILIHMGGERTFRAIAPEMNNVDLLRFPLDLGVTVICAHSGTKIFGSREKDRTNTIRELLERYPRLWVDNAGLCNPARFIHVKKLASDPVFSERTLYGSDWPVPTNAFYFTRQLGLGNVLRLESIKNPIARDIAVKGKMGYPDETLTRASAVLANLDRWSV